MNDPSLSVSFVGIIGNSFINMGQASFQGNVALSEAATAPGPTVIEMWRLNRYCHRSHGTAQQRETYRTTTLFMSGNIIVYSERNPKPIPTVMLCTDPSKMRDAAKCFDLTLVDNSMKKLVSFRSQPN